MTKSRGINRSKHRWSAEDIACLRFWFPHNRSQDLANTMGLRLLQVVQQANRLKLHKSAAYLASPEACRMRRGNGPDHPGFAYQLKKGIVPANKGLRRPGYSVGRGRMQSTQFKKGQKPRHAKARMPAGTFDDPLGDAYKLARAAIDAASGKP